MNDSHQRLHDERAIRALAVRYCWALDDNDWGRLAEVFLPDATACFDGRTLLDGLGEITAKCRRALSHLDASHHMVTNHQVSLAGDRADHRCYLQAQHVRADAAAGPNFIVAGRYLDRVVRTPEGWRIKHRDLIVMWTDGNPEAPRRV